MVAKLPCLLRKIPKRRPLALNLTTIQLEMETIISGSARLTTLWQEIPIALMILVMRGSSKYERIYFKKAVSGIEGDPVKGGDKNYMLRKSSQHSQALAGARPKLTSTVYEQTRVKLSGPGSGKRGRPRKHRPETNDITPANWKWRSNVSVPLTDLGKVTCHYRGCKQTVTSVGTHEK